MDSKKRIVTNTKLLYIILSFFVFGWSQTAKAQYNLQLDSVITEVVSGSFDLNTTNIVYEVPEGKVWKIEALFCSGGGSWGDTRGWIDLRIIDSKGKQMTLNKYGSNAATNIKVNASHNSFDDTGLVWLNEGCKIKFSIYGADRLSNSGGFYRGLLSALQFSTQ